MLRSVIGGLGGCFGAIRFALVIVLDDVMAQGRYSPHGSPVRTGGWRVPGRGEPVSSMNQTTKEKRADFIREAIEEELKRREAKPHK
jgi:hypothetical protein